MYVVGLLYDVPVPVSTISVLLQMTAPLRNSSDGWRLSKIYSIALAWWQFLRGVDCIALCVAYSS